MILCFNGVIHGSNFNFCTYRLFFDTESQRLEERNVISLFPSLDNLENREVITITITLKCLILDIYVGNASYDVI